MKLLNCLFFAGLLFITSCNKKTKAPEEEVPIVPVTPGVTDAGTPCENLPATPQPFGWQDSIVDPNKSVNAFLFDPTNANRVIFTVIGDVMGYNKLFFYNIVTQETTLLGAAGDYLPQVNLDGLITFSDAENSIILIKKDGSAVTLAANKYGHDPKWDHTGKFIYYFSEGHESFPAQVLKIDLTGNVVDVLPIASAHSAFFRNSSKVICVEVKNDKAYLIEKDIGPPYLERNLLITPAESKPGQLYFDNLTLDRTDENVYWSNSFGIFKCNLTSLKVDTVLKNCPNRIYNNPIVSFKENELTYTQHILKPLSSWVLFHEYKAMEMNLNTKQATEIKIFP